MPVVTKKPKLKSNRNELTIQERFGEARTLLSTTLIEREEEVDILLSALLCGENPLLVGPPGTAKSLLIDCLMNFISGSTKFSWQINKFTVPEEIFGPISVRGLEDDDYRRITLGKLPEATVAYLDEVFKGTSAILNSLLKVLNEKMFDNGLDGAVKVPLLCCLASSNEHPNDQEGGKELAAVYDRFLFRKNVSYIQGQEGRTRLLWTFEEPVFDDSIKVSPQDIQTAKLQAMRLPFQKDAVEAFAEILEDLAKEGIQPGDRRQRKSVDACRAFAYLRGADEERGVIKEDLDILSHILWVDPLEQPQKCAKIVARIANPVGSKVSDVVNQAKDVIKNNNAQDALNKLKELNDSLTEIGRYTKHEKINKAKDWIGRQIKLQYHKVTGLKE